MDTNPSINLERAELQPCTIAEPPPELKKVNSQIPLPATITVSSGLVEDLLIQLLLRLNPLRSPVGAHLDQQQLLTLCLHLDVLTLETLRKVPDVFVDETVPPPPCNTWKAAVLLQSSLMKRFGSSIQVRKQLVRNDPELLRFIPHHIVEAVLAISKAESAGETTPNQTASDEELFAQFLPETTKEEMFERYGSWIRKTKVFQRAFPQITKEDFLEFQRHISRPRLSNRDVVWVERKYVVADFYEETITDAAAHSFMLQKPFIDQTGDHTLVSSTETKDELQSFKLPQIFNLQLIAGDCKAVQEDLIIHSTLVKKTTIKSVLAELFKGKDKTFYRPQHQRNRAFENEMVEHIHLLLQKEAKKYARNRLFLKSLKHLEDPQNELKMSEELCPTLKASLWEALPNTWLTRESLMEDVSTAMIACRIIATEIFNYLKPTVTFAAGTKPGGEAPYNLNIPINREDAEPEREPTKLELRLQEERSAAREEFLTETVTELQQPTDKTKKKRNKFFSWLSKLSKWRKSF